MPVIPSAVPGSATVAAALLLPQDRIPRAPLSAWAARLRDNVAAFRRKCRNSDALSAEAGGAGNNAALVAASRGDAAGAWQLCERQIHWQQRLSRRAGNPAIAVRCVQPWVNLARLDALAGDWEAAVARLERLRPLTRTSAIALQPLRRDGTGCSRIDLGSDEEFAGVLDNIYVIDTLRALLQNRRWDEVLRFGEVVRREFRPGLGLWALEASVVAACRTGDAAGARRLGQAALDRNDATAWRRLVFRLRLAEVDACTGEHDRAAASLAILVRGARKLSPDACARLQSLYVLNRLAAACLECGLAGDAMDVARAVYEGARASGDEVFEIEALQTLTRAAPGEERGEWERALAGLRQRTEYRQHRAPDAPAAEAPQIDALVADLLHVYAA